MAHVIAIANRKGGVGKTTTALSLGAALASRGHQVLLVDLDGQQSLAQSLKMPIPKPGLADALFTQFAIGVGELRDILVKASGMMVAAGYGLAHTDSELCYYGSGWEHAVRMALEPELENYDFAILDCSPSLGCLTINALTAADEVIVPVQTEFLAVSQLSATMAAVENVRGSLHAQLEVAGFLPTLFDFRTRHAVEILMRISTEADRYGVRVFRPVPRTVRVPEAAASGRPLADYAPRSAAAIAYDALASEIERKRDHDLRRSATRPAPTTKHDELQLICERAAADHLRPSMPNRHTSVPTTV